MTEKVKPGINIPIPNNNSFGDTVSIHTKKIYDSCKDKDCIEDLRLYLTRESQRVIDNSVSVRAKRAVLLHVSVEVDEITFNRGYYTVDLRFFYKVYGEAYTLIGKPIDIVGLAIFDKRIMLFGSEGNAKVFTSQTVLGGVDKRTIESGKLPTAVVEAVDPIVLGMRIYDWFEGGHDNRPGWDNKPGWDNQPGNNWPSNNANAPVGPNAATPLGYGSSNLGELPESIHDHFGGDLFFDTVQRHVYVTLGQFSIVRLERDTTLVVPSYDYFVPTKECVGGSEDDACSLFSKIRFPVDEFFPPDILEAPEGYREAKSIL